MMFTNFSERARERGKDRERECVCERERYTQRACVCVCSCDREIVCVRRDYKRDKRRDSVRKTKKTTGRMRESNIHTERKGVHVFVIRHRKKERKTGRKTG